MFFKPKPTNLEIGLSWLYLLTGTIFFISPACRKSSEPSDKFNAAAAKEWYYANFKRSAEWQSSPLHGKKLPDWKNGIYKKTGNLELVEFPLSAAKKVVSVESGKAISPAQQVRTAEASLSRIVFIKNNNSIIVREVDYIPDANYLQRSGFDISHVSLAKSENDFSGRLVVKTWGGKQLSLWMMENGTITKRGHVRYAPADKNNSSRNTAENCNEVIICEYEQQCTEYWQGDIFLGEECGPWISTGNCWTEEYCEEEECNLSLEECLCTVYGICDNGGGGDEPCNIPDLDAILAVGMPMAENVHISTDPEINNGGTITRKWHARWKFYKGTFPFYTWYYISFEQGTHKKEGGVWKWENISHVSHSQQGASPFTTTCTMIQAVGSIAANKLRAFMELTYEIKMCVECNGINMGCRARTETVPNDWPVE